MIKKIKYLKNHKQFIKYFKNTSWMMAEQILRILAGLFVGIWVARYLEPEQFGIYSYILAFTSIFAGISKLGLDDIVIRELVNDSKKKMCLFRNSILVENFWCNSISNSNNNNTTIYK